jgi:hypothetical protein
MTRLPMKLSLGKLSRLMVEHEVEGMNGAYLCGSDIYTRLSLLMTNTTWPVTKLGCTADKARA